MERALWMIVAIVAVVGVVGMFVTHTPATLVTGEDAFGNGLTGNVVRQGQVDCSSCSGDPVCGKINHRYKTYANACAASCSGATVAVHYACEDIPS